MSFAVALSFDKLRSLAFGSISGTYAAVGAKVAFAARMFRLINNTDGDMLFSDDGTNDKLFCPANSFVLYDVTANRQSANNVLSLPAGIQFYVKQSTAPTKGAVYVEILYAVTPNTVT